MSGKTCKTVAIAEAIAKYTHEECVPLYARIDPQKLVNLNLKPIHTFESMIGSKGYEVYAFQWGDVTILALYDSSNGDIRIKTQCW